jgi:DNA polymerase type B, organellar and viral
VRTADWSCGEARIGDTGYRLDALVTRPFGKPALAIEFMGCYFHGCPRCYGDRTHPLAGGRTAEELYESTMQRIAEIRRLGNYKVRLVWECQWNAYLRKDQELARAYRELALPSAPLQLRADAYFGGRVETFRMLHECAADEEIVAIDVNSLYPAMMKYRAYPMHNPLVLTREQLVLVSPLPWTVPANNRWQGILHVRVLPPQNLRRPVLPYRTTDGQLHFTLCARCSELEQQERCRHAPHLRAWIAGYPHDELNKALSLGYVVLDVFEVWHWEVRRHSGSSNRASILGVGLS